MWAENNTKFVFLRSETMNICIFILISMLFLHIVDDYYLQGWLASAKQRSWWESNAPYSLYKCDYIMALFCHSFSWSFMINLPIVIYSLYTGDTWYASALVINLFIHMFVDNEKANRKTINLIQDQCIHFAQIVATWLFWIWI